MSKDKLTQSIVIFVFVAILGTAGFFGFKEIKKALNPSQKDGAGIPLSGGVPAGRGGSDAGEEQTYTHPDYGFTLRYPGNLKLGKFPEGEGEILLLQPTPSLPSENGGGASVPPLNERGGQEGLGFQIFISPYNETEEFSKEVILKADPKMKIENDKIISLGAEEISALTFDSSNDSGSTHEVWFVADGNLYQATSFQQYGEEMERILGSLRFD